MSENIFFDKDDLRYCGENVIIGKTVRIRRPELVSVGDNYIIDDFTYISGAVEVGSYTHIAAGCSFQASGSKITLGDFVGVATGVKMFATTTDFVFCSFDSATIPQDLTYGAITEEVDISDFVLIGANSVILPGCNLPTGFSIGALTKVHKNSSYEPWTALIDPNTGECVRPPGKDRLIDTALRLLNNSL